jgi:endo-alpha-1,4-polygalactosaminidase (GH114 family)
MGHKVQQVAGGNFSLIAAKLKGKQYNSVPVSSEEYLYYLTLAQRKGLFIFTVDYALNPANIAWVYRTSRGLGFVPFVSNRQLDQYVDPVP